MGKVQENIPEGVVGWWVLSLSNLGLPSPQGDLLYSSPGARTQCHFWTVPVTILTALGRPFSRLTYMFYRAWWLRIASWRCFSGFMVLRNSCSMSLACLFSDWIQFSPKKLCLFWVDWSPTLGRLESASYYCTLLWRKGEDYFSTKLHVRSKVNNSPHWKFHRFLFPFSSTFSDLNFASLVLYIYPCYIIWHTQTAWVTYGFNRFTPKSDYMDFTLSNARWFYTSVPYMSKGDPLGVIGFKKLSPLTLSLPRVTL